MDLDEGIIFFHLDFVLNLPSWPADQVHALLDQLAQDPLLHFVIHEQYFYSDYNNYEPDYAQRVLNTCQWAFDHGYRFLSLTGLVRDAAPEFFR